MITPMGGNEISDARLVAYIDGELSPDERREVAHALEASPELRERLEFLDRGGRPFADAFDLLTQAAPDDRLQAMFAGLLDSDNQRSASSDAEETVIPLRPASAPPWRSTGWQLAAAASFALTVFGAGIVTGVLYGPRPQIEEAITQRNWMDAVAQYVSLFSAETLAGMPADQQAMVAGLARVSQALGKDISHDRVAGLPSLDFRGTQLLQLEGRPIAQIAFQSETGKPVAICIIRTPRAPEAPAPERRQGLNIVHWIEGGYGYMVIGDLPEADIARISNAARQRLS